MTQESTDTSRLLLMVGEIRADIKHLLGGQVTQDRRIEALDVRLQVLERLRWKIIGIATAVPTAIAMATTYLDRGS